MDQQAEKRQKKRQESNRTGQKKKRGDNKVESNDNPEISDQGGDIRLPLPPFGSIDQWRLTR